MLSIPDLKSYFYGMKKPIGRRSFIKKSGGVAIGLSVLPGSVMLLDSCNQDFSYYPDVDWEEMMSAHDMLWTVVPKDMTEAPHFGNGLIGSMFWIENNEIRMQVFRSDVHDHNDHTYGWSAYSRPRYQIGYFTLKVKGEITDCDLRQDIYNAELKGTINTSLGSFKIDHFIHRFDDVIYTDIAASGDEELSDWQWHPFEARTSRGGSPESYGKAYSPYNKVENPDHIVEKHGDVSVGLQDLNASGSYATAWKETREGEKKGRILISIQNSYPQKTSDKDAIRIIKNSQEKIRTKLRKWRQEHQDWWHEYYPESYVSFPDPKGESFYWNNVYRLACCTRPDAQYIDTTGMWSSGGPWPYSTHDFNTQTVHFPVYSSNRLHLGEALVNALKRNKKNLIDNVVPEEWQEDSALLNLATAFDMKGKRDGDRRYKDLLGCLPWLLNNVWFHYRYTMDKEILKDPLFPLLRRSVNLYRHILYEGEDGKLHLPPTYVPEIGTYRDSNFDLALLKWGCARLLEICDILDVSDPLKPEWESIIRNLTEFPRDELGYMLGSEESAPAAHRHMSYLMMIYPLYLDNLENTDTDLLRKSVINYEPEWAPKMGASQASPVAAAVGLGNLAHKRMNYILYRENKNETLGINGIYYLATPCIETSLSYNTCVQDMLLQSWGNKIRIFPALPDVWKDVEFNNFRTEGAFLVSAKLVNGKTSFIRIKSLAGEPCFLKSFLPEKLTIANGRGINIEELEDGCYKIDIKKGEEVILCPV